jgi:predicted CopG family antitoxin
VKTITLDEPAYNRLKAWKRGNKDSFSAVVKRVVPAPGTLGAILSFVKSRRTEDLARNDVMEATINQRATEKNDPWT